MSDNNLVDNPLLYRDGKPFEKTDFYDSTYRVVDPSGLQVNDYNGPNFFRQQAIWNADPSKSYNDDDLGGIDVTPNGNKKIDLGRFNSEFDKQLDNTNYFQDEIDKNYLDALGKKENIIKKVSIYDILINIKDTWYNIINDLAEHKYDKSVILKDDRLFYVGLTFVVYVVLTYLFHSLRNDKKIYYVKR
jgi:hypothetical protein